MARIVKDPVVRRNEILNVAERLISTKGYEQMAIQDIVDELQIAKGTVYHYFDSKIAVLEALVERMGDRVEQLLLPIVHDQSAGALDKLLRYFAAIDHMKRAQPRLMIEFTRIWYDDENAIVLRKLYRAGIKRFTPWLSQIIQQGIAEGVFTTAYPEQAARMIIALRNDLGTAIAELLLSEEDTASTISQVARIANATIDVLERVLGAEPGSLPRTSDEELVQWTEGQQKT
jgi:TetR/AcrR family transcriptional repressor of nem operon